jgi:hypothetical protein
MLNKEQADALAVQVLQQVRPAMRVAIGDRTPRQFDRADTFAVRLVQGVKEALVKQGLADEKEIMC